jgi:hypothetical protein
MMGIWMPETCLAVFKRQEINLSLIAASSWLIRLNACLEFLYDFCLKYFFVLRKTERAKIENVY